MITVLQGFGGPVSWYPRDAEGNPRRPDASPTVQVVSGTGGELVPAGTAATLDSVNTTLAAGVEDTMRTVEVLSGTGIARGTRYVITEPYEEVEVSNVSGTTVYLSSPLWYSHGPGAAFQGHQITVTLNASQAATAADHCQALFSWALSTVPQVRGQVDFAITHNKPVCPWSEVDLVKVDPDLQKKLAANVNIRALCNLAFEEVMSDLSAGGLWSYDYIGSERLRQAGVYKTMHLCSEHYGRSFKDDRDHWWNRYRESLAQFRSIAAFDDNRDGKVSTQETNRGLRTFTLVRSS